MTQQALPDTKITTQLSSDLLVGKGLPGRIEVFLATHTNRELHL